MKALKINAPVILKSGLQTAPGAIVILTEGYADIKSLKDDLIPCQIITAAFASLEDMDAGKAPLQDILDFNTAFMGLKLSVKSYETLPTQDLLIGAVNAALLVVYPESVEVIELVKKEAEK